MKNVKTETITEFLARGGTIKVVPPVVDESQIVQTVGFSTGRWRPTDAEDWRDGQSPNLRWLKGRRHVPSRR